MLIMVNFLVYFTNIHLNEIVLFGIPQIEYILDIRSYAFFLAVIL